MKQVLILTLAFLLLGSCLGYGQVVPPANLTATVVTSGNLPAVALAWQYVSTTTHTKFNLYKKTGPIGDTTFPFVRIWSGRDVRFVDKMVHQGTYTYYATAVVNQIESQPSNLAEATILPPATGKITGTLTDDMTSTPVMGMVTFISVLNSGTRPRTVPTDSNGIFVAILQPGQYVMYFTSNGYIPEYFDNVSTIRQAAKIRLSQNDSLVFAVGLTKVQPRTFGIISGTVTDDATGLPIPRGEVQLITDEYPTFAPIIARLDSNGYFKFRVLTGHYYLVTRSMGYVQEYYDNVVDYQQATQLTLNENDSLVLAIGLAKVQPPYTGLVSGILVDDGTSAPVKNGVIHFIPAINALGDPKSVPTDSNGYFKARLKTGQYYMKFDARAYVPEFYDNVATLQEAAAITVNENDSLVFSIGLAKVPPPVFYTLSGWVKDANDVPQKATVCAFIVNRKHNFSDRYQRKLFAYTDSLGNYSLSFKENDTVVLFYTPYNKALMNEYWNDKRTFNDADRIIAGGNVTDVNVILDPKRVYNNGISGMVTDSTGVTSLKGYVYAYKKVNGRLAYSRYYALTDTSTGTYAMQNMEPGTYLLLAWVKGYKSSYFRFDGMPTMDWRQADTLVVTSSDVTADINFRLLPVKRRNASAAVYGNVRTASGAVVDFALAYAIDSDGEVAGWSVTDLDGSFEIDGLSTGSYTLVSNSVDYRTTQTTDIIVTDNTTMQVDVVMSPDEVTGVVEQARTASGYKLAQNFPNPFNPATQISFEVPTTGNVKVKVYNILGNEVATLVNGVVPAGVHQVSFDGSNLNSGVYYVKLEANNTLISVRKMTLMK